MSRFFIGFRDRNRPSRNGRFRRGIAFSPENFAALSFATLTSFCIFGFPRFSALPA